MLSELNAQLTGWLQTHLLEIAANLVNLLSIWLAARNSIQTWWTGIVGCTLFGILFFNAQLYADVTLQLFFIGASLAGWLNWQNREKHVRSARHSHPLLLAGLAGAALLVTAGYGLLLHRLTNAYAPFIDSAVLAFSVVGQCLLMGRRIENWWAWLIVNTLAVPLYFSRELYLTAIFYAFFWLNAWHGLWHWRREARLAAQAA